MHEPPASCWTPLGTAKTTNLISAAEPAPGNDLPNRLPESGYSEAQRAMYAAEMATMSRGGDRRSSDQTPKTVLDRVRPIRIEDAAKTMGVAESCVIMAKKVVRDGVPEVVDAVRDGATCPAAASKPVEAPDGA